ncbi:MULTISPECIES: stalk domain-containing protein [unclassified Flavobacterium]|uniref:stalk domain-containing protein n=1 Tax=unclassified Flavobacterium TaxID=196869 RepID=UPI003F8F3DD0
MMNNFIKTRYPRISTLTELPGQVTYILSFLFFLSFSVSAQHENIAIKNQAFASNYDVIPLQFNVNNLFSFESDVIITEEEIVFVNVEEVFKQLGIAINVNVSEKTITGFIKYESNNYKIDIDKEILSVGNKSTSSVNGIYQVMNSIFIKSSLIADEFGIQLIYNPRSLTIKVESNFELPKLKQARLENIRTNITKLQSNTQTVSDTIVGREYHLFKGTTMNWAASAFETSGQAFASTVNLSLGTEFLYGETNVAFFLSSQNKFDARQLQYNWRWVNNESKFIRQAQVGKIYSQSISFLRAPLVGATFTNSSNSVRKARGTYTISEFTEPNWTVELYINDALVDHTIADGSGLFLFNVPIVYGYSTLKLKFYGLVGEERIEERNMNIPYTFMPPKVLEYNVVAGVLEDENLSQYGRGEFNYGFNRFITIGGGVEYLSSISHQPVLPFATIAFQPFSKVVVNLEYVHNVSLKSLLNYSLGSSSFLELDYRKYVEGQQVSLNRTLEERSIRFTFPFAINKVTGNTKISYNQFLYKGFAYNSMEALFSGRYENYAANASLSSNWISGGTYFLSSNLTLSYKLNNGLLIRPVVQYNFTDNQLMRHGVSVEKRLSNMSFSTAYFKNYQNNTDNFLLSYSYDLNSARSYFTAAYNNKRFNSSQSAQGGIAFGGDNGYIKAGSNSSVGRGGILFYPFLDLNRNGKKDIGERTVFVKNVKVLNGRASTSIKDSIVRISDLNSFIKYKVEFLDADLDNISWNFKHHSYEVLVDPNQYKKVEVPIVVMGEVSGMVYLNSNKDSNGQGRVIVEIYNSNGLKVAETLSESDGYFYYLGLQPGQYTVKIDQQQLDKLSYQSNPGIHKVTIEVAEDGTVVDGLDFHLSVKDRKATSELTQSDKKNQVQSSSSNGNTNTKPLSDVINSKEIFYSIQIGRYKNDGVPNTVKNLDLVFYEELEADELMYYYGFFRTRDRAIIAKNTLVLRGINGTSIVAYQFGTKISEVTPNLNGQIAVNTAENGVGLPMDLRVNTTFEKISSIHEDFFSVQIGVFKKYVPSKILNNFNPVYYEFIAGERIRYISGKFKTFQEARKMKYKITAKGIKDAYIVKYNNGIDKNSK